MSAYRFCRSDDIPLLVRAYNACYRVHFPQLPELDVDGLRQAIRRIDLWTSSCMIAAEGQRPIGVLLAAKRETESLVWAVGVHPDHLRRGHGRHLLESLSSKLAILGPPRLLAEVPAEWGHARQFLETCGYVPERVYTDFLLHERPAHPPASDFVVPITVDELVSHGALDVRVPRCWERAPASLLARRTAVQGTAILSDERVEAYLLYHEPGPRGLREILDFGCARVERREPLLALLFGSCCADVESPLRLRRVAPDEIDFGLLERLGFRAIGRTIGYAAQARSA